MQTENETEGKEALPSAGADSGAAAAMVTNQSSDDQSSKETWDDVTDTDFKLAARETIVDAMTRFAWMHLIETILF